MAIIVVDQSGGIVIVNQLAERLFGYSRQELLAMPIEGLVPQRFRAQHVGDRDSYFREPRTRPDQRLIAADIEAILKKLGYLVVGPVDSATPQLH